MNSELIEIIIIRGAPGSGKSQTAKSLSEFFPRGVRLEIDTIRSMVISADWTNQDEHVSMLAASVNLVQDFMKQGFSPIIVVDTFSGGKLVQYLINLNRLKTKLAVQIIGLYTSDEELTRRIEARPHGEFKDSSICHSLNDEVRNEKYDGEYQIDTTGLLPIETAKLIYAKLDDPT